MTSTFWCPRQDLERVEQALRTAGWQSSDRSPHDDRYYREWMHEILASVASRPPVRR